MQSDNPYQVSSEEVFDLTKQDILSKIRQEDIFKHYLGVEPVIGKKFRAPEMLRKDKHPTCTFKWIRGKLLYRDWAEPNPCDCFVVVQRLYSCDFKSALKIVANDFGLSNVNGIKRGVVPSFRITKTAKPSTVDKSEIRIKRQKFIEGDIEYLSSYHISSDTCRLFRCSGVEKVWLNGILIYQYKKDDPAIVYHLKGYEYKIYFYRRPTQRFLCNTIAIQGWKQLPHKGELLIITKSMKDVMVLYEAGYNAIAPQSENQIIDEGIIKNLKKRFSNIVTLFDFDYTGITSANRYRKLYGIEALFLTNGRFGTIDYKSKDPADYSKNFGIRKLKELAHEIRTKRSKYQSIRCI